MLINYHLTHNLKVAGSNPAPATNLLHSSADIYAEHVQSFCQQKHGLGLPSQWHTPDFAMVLFVTGTLICPQPFMYIYVFTDIEDKAACVLSKQGCTQAGAIFD